MNKTVIIIPSRLTAVRLPNKPLLEIDNKPIIIHVLDRAKESKIGDVVVATPDKEIFDLVKKNSGKAFMTNKNHSTGTDRVYEALQKLSDDKINLIINLQGDMPNIKPKSILKLEKLMRDNNCDIGTLASPLKENEIYNKNIVKVYVEKELKEDSFVNAKDFIREPIATYDLKYLYHHIGIYAFTKHALIKYVKLARSKMEIKRNLEQLRALDNNIAIKIGLSNSTPLGIDTKEDFLSIKKSMEYK